MSDFLSSSGAGRKGPDELSVLLAQADFELPEPYLSELRDAYAHVQRMKARVHRNYRYDEEPAHVFHPRTFEPTGGPR
jgi:hypothetical protein